MNMLLVGDMVVPNLQEEAKLLLWSDGNLPITVTAEIEPDAVLMIIKIQKFSEADKSKRQHEWEHSSCLLLGPAGEMGWTGAGWIKKVTSEL